MKPEAEEIAQKALSLTREGRAFLAERLLESLEFDDDFEFSEAWTNEVLRRCREIDAGEVQLIPGEQVFSEMAEEAG